jgi:AlwI restriction endonuclease
LATKKTIRPWYFGNTTVRSPFRLRDGLLLISTSSLQGNLHGTEQEIAFCNLLGKAGIVNLKGDDTYSVGRKWRAALSQHGFLYPQVTKKSGINQLEVGQVDTITPNGWNLIRSETVAGMQECFLRSMASYYVPNVLDTQAYSFSTTFSPLRHILKIMLELEKQTGSNKLEFLEIALFVLWTNSEDAIDQITSSILKFRKDKSESERKRKFNQAAISNAASQYGYADTTFGDYADLTIRYLKATGLVQAKGHGITLVPEKHFFIERYAADSHIPSSDKDYLIELCNGAQLPTDDEVTAKLVLNDLVGKLNSRGEQFDLTSRNISDVANLNIVRHEIEDKISILNEIDYAKTQCKQWEEIAAYMDLLITNSRSKKLATSDDDEDLEIGIPQGEAPAYFEWVIWRAFLAINNLKNPPNDCRKFKIDQDFLPISTAPGGGPDLIFEFEDFVVVVEVTLTTSSRQEAAEGEPVRRHVADCVQDYANKKVYGLFLANQIDSNTAETFRFGIWYLKDDQKLNLDIVPLPLLQFKELFEAMFKSSSVKNSHIQDVLIKCRDLNSHESPVWKRKITEEVSSYSAALTA